MRGVGMWGNMERRKGSDLEVWEPWEISIGDYESECSRFQFADGLSAMMVDGRTGRRRASTDCLWPTCQL